MEKITRVNFDGTKKEKSILDGLGKRKTLFSTKMEDGTVTTEIKGKKLDIIFSFYQLLVNSQQFREIIDGAIGAYNNYKEKKEDK